MSPLEDDKEEVKSEPEETITKRVKLNSKKEKKKGKWLKNFNSIETINQTFNVISTIKSWK